MTKVGDKLVHTFPKGISLKVNVIARLEFELTYYDAAVQHISHYSPPIISSEITLEDMMYNKKCRTNFIANITQLQKRNLCYILTLDRAVNQEMHLCK